jgi:hypothetical protein
MGTADVNNLTISEILFNIYCHVVPATHKIQVFIAALTSPVAVNQPKRRLTHCLYQIGAVSFMCTLGLICIIDGVQASLCGGYVYTMYSYCNIFIIRLITANNYQPRL